MRPADPARDETARTPLAQDLPVLDAAVVRRWATGATTALGDHRAALDDLNVFPVADSDTGTNLFLTLTDAAAALDRLDPAAGTDEVVRAFTRGAVRGARGNSGVIVSQYVAVLCVSLSGRALTVPVLLDGLDRAARAAHGTVAHPVEGTVLTVARAVRDGADDGPTAPPLQVLGRALTEGYAALARTTSQLAALRAAGVRDAGAWGLLLVLDALAQALGTPATRRPDQSRPAGTSVGPRPTSPDTPGAAETGCVTGPATSPHDAGEGGEFEVMYLVTEPAGAPGGDGAAPAGPSSRGLGAAPRDLAVELRAALDEVGGSVAVVGADGLWQAHVHTDDPFAAMAIPGRLGVHQEQVGVRHLPSQSGVHGARRRGLGLVAVTSARALVPDLARAGAVVMASDGPPTPAALDRALDDTGARRVLVLSGPQVGEVTHHGGAGPVRIEVVDGLWGVEVVVGAATFAAAGTTSDDVDDLLGEVIAAVDGVRCAALDAGDDLAGAIDPLLHPGATLVAVLTSQETSEADVEALRAHLAGVRPDVEVVVLPSGEPGRRLVLGVE